MSTTPRRPTRIRFAFLCLGSMIALGGALALALSPEPRPGQVSPQFVELFEKTESPSYRMLMDCWLMNPPPGADDWVELPISACRALPEQLRVEQPLQPVSFCQMGMPRIQVRLADQKATLDLIAGPRVRLELEYDDGRFFATYAPQDTWKTVFRALRAEHPVLADAALR